jgi:hypothetical protein
MKTPIEATRLYDLICKMEKDKVRPEDILGDIKKILVNEIWPEKLTKFKPSVIDDNYVDINYDFHEGRGEDNEIL